ncbi:katanin p60 ATPase-containing subunit A-like 2 [Tribolium madens]|uniref:katanin p60 ATPase-containing subunit A-like 2 n=1 Tax=Tribolium madens TaxID=41895 RepID=UPI001CF73026|nr:katanin p60 ATPase-containing subunit A-like 2 [Tribolium madens]
MMEIHLPIKNSSKTTNTLKENLKKETQERKRNILHLIFKYLVDNNLLSVAEVLQNETQTGIYYQVCDNIDLEIILQEYQSYYYTKFQKQPKILRKTTENEKVIPLKKERKSAAKEKQPLKQEKSNDTFQFEIVTLSKESSLSDIQSKPLIDFENYSSEWREMADQIIKQIVTKTLGITFKDCISLSSTIETLKEAIIYPLSYPQLFEKACTWRGVLLYGPPGTGKTLLAKALACESPSTFINVTSSAFISKWRGESEKMVKVLFDVAKFYSPTTIFIDEIDALASKSHDSDHEASRRFKSELLTQIDGIVKNEEVFVLATTNNPWTIDNALLRRFEKRILVPLPDKDSRSELFQYYFSKNGYDFKNEDLTAFVNLTESFSGSDVKNVCKEVEMILIREKLDQIRRGDRKKCGTRQVKSDDVLNALKKIKPCIEQTDYKKYLEWGRKYGAT